MVHYEFLGTGPTSKEEYELEMATAAETYKSVELPDDQLILVTDPGRLTAAEAVFVENCATCHRQDGGDIADEQGNNHQDVNQNPDFTQETLLQSHRRFFGCEERNGSQHEEGTAQYCPEMPRKKLNYRFHNRAIKVEWWQMNHCLPGQAALRPYSWHAACASGVRRRLNRGRR